MPCASMMEKFSRRRGTGHRQVQPLRVDGQVGNVPRVTPARRPRPAVLMPQPNRRRRLSKQFALPGFCVQFNRIEEINR